MFKRIKSKTEKSLSHSTEQIEEKFVEQQLWQKMKSGDKEAFSQLFLYYYKPLNQYGLNIYSDSDITRDCIQELFLEVWQYRETLADIDSVKYYLLKSFRRKLLRKLETIRKYPLHVLKDTYEHTVNDSLETLLIDQQTELTQKLYISKELENLPKRQQEAIYLKFYQDLSYEKIAEVMSLNYQSVKNLVYTGMKSLRENLIHKDIFIIACMIGTWL